MNRKLIPFLVGSLLAATAAAAADDEFTLSGSVSIGARGTSREGGTRNGANATSATTTAPFTGPRDEAKLNEYRDVSGGAIGNIDLQGRSSQDYVRFFGENIGRDDEFLNLRGGQYGEFKYQLYQDKMPHNLSWNALTPLSGTGGTLLTGPGGVYPSTPGTNAQLENSANWKAFDYKLQRNTYAGNFEFTANSPWHVRVDYVENQMEGVRPQSSRLGTGSGNGMIEFGVPVDYKTKTYSLDTGYSTKEGSWRFSVLDSKFTNGNPLMQWTNFYMQNALDTNLLPPDNDLKRVSFNGMLRQLPLDSTLAVRFTWSKQTNNFGVTSGGLMPTSSASPPPVGGVGTLVTTPSSGTFNGDTETRTASLSYTSAWGGGVDSRIYWNYYDTLNNSTVVTYAQGFLGTGPCPGASFASTSTATQFCIGPYPNSLLSYNKQDYGIDVGWRINRGNKVSGGANLLEVDREGREDAELTKESKFWLEYKNSMLESLSGRLKYQFLRRRSDLNPAFPPGTSPFLNNTGAPNTGFTPAQVPYYYRAYDVSNNDQNQIKLVLDWTPMPLLDTGFELGLKKTDYKALYYGRTDDLRQEYNVTVSFGNPKQFRITGLANYEIVEFNQAYRNIAAGQSPTPGGTQTTTTFDWGTKNTQTNRLFGLIADWPVIERLALKGSYTWTKTGGGVDFTSGSPFTPAGQGNYNGGPLVNYVTDNTKKQTLNLKGDYKFDKRWSATLGYVHEKYDYADDQMRSYQSYYPYYQNLGGTNLSWFSGAFANPSYKLDVYYVMGTYKF